MNTLKQIRNILGKACEKEIHFFAVLKKQRIFLQLFHSFCFSFFGETAIFTPSFLSFITYLVFITYFFLSLSRIKNNIYLSVRNIFEGCSITIFIICLNIGD